MTAYTHSDIELVNRFRSGDDAAFTTIYDQHYFLIYQYAKRWLQTRQDAEDVTADTFIKLLAHRAQFENMENIAAFLKITVRNACFNFLKHDKVKTEKHAELFKQISVEVSPDFSWIYIREEFLKMIYSEVDKLPAKMKEIFLLSYKEGLKPSEIAERLNLSVQTVSNQKTTAIKLLKAALGDQSLLYALLLYITH